MIIKMLLLFLFHFIFQHIQGTLIVGFCSNVLDFVLTLTTLLNAKIQKESVGI